VREAAGISFQTSECEQVARKRELIDIGADERCVRRNKLGTSFVEADDVSRSLAAERRQHAKTKVKTWRRRQRRPAAPQDQTQGRKLDQQESSQSERRRSEAARKKGVKRRYSPVQLLKPGASISARLIDIRV
jgi:hypothetical protein